MAKKIIIVGDRSFAEIAAEYFGAWSEYEPVAFAVHEEFRCRDQVLGLPNRPLEQLEKEFSTDDHVFFAAIPYQKLNRTRMALMNEVKAKGFKPASFISPHAFVAPSARVGEHCFIFENNVVQSFVTIGDNVVLWSGNHIGHHSAIDDNVFVSSHVVVSGHCTIGKNCFLGVNATLTNDINIGDDCWIGPGALLTKDAPADSVWRTTQTDMSPVSSMRMNKVPKN